MDRKNKRRRNRSSINRLDIDTLDALNERLIEKGAFKDQKEIDNHIENIEIENNKLDKVSRMRELENWLNYLYLE